MNNYLTDTFGIDERIVKLIEETEVELRNEFTKLDKLAEFNQYKVLKAFQENKISDTHFQWNTGYGYDDQGREAVERVFATTFGTESALVRTNIVNGTHALSLVLSGLLRPYDELIYVGKPYDTLEEVIGVRGSNMGSLSEFHISYKEVMLDEEGRIDEEAILNAISDKTKIVAFQRATGYGFRASISMQTLKKTAGKIKERFPHVILMADNCYGEFLDTVEPTQVGIDIMAGSLIKNPGGGIALTGGYVCGKKELVDLISYRLTCPGIGKECGLTFGQTRNMLQGFFLAPTTSINAVKGAMLCGLVFSKLGYDVCPSPTDVRSDIIQAISLGSEDKVVAFCQGVQKAAPIDSFVVPIAWDMPGYDSKVIMAAGAFVQGSSIELSCDAPIREPYNAYFQGGLTYAHSKMGVMMGMQELIAKGLLDL